MVSPLELSEGRPPRGLSFSAVVVVVALAGVSCSSAPDPGPEGEPDLSGDKSIAIGFTFEEAAFVVSGELFDIYGADAEPLPIKVVGNVVADPGPMWMIETDIDVGAGADRRIVIWRFWPEEDAAGQIQVVTSEGPSDR